MNEMKEKRISNGKDEDKWLLYNIKLLVEEMASTNLAYDLSVISVLRNWSATRSLINFIFCRIFTKSHGKTEMVLTGGCYRVFFFFLYIHTYAQIYTVSI